MMGASDLASPRCVRMLAGLCLLVGWLIGSVLGAVVGHPGVVPHAKQDSINFSNEKRVVSETCRFIFA